MSILNTKLNSIRSEIILGGNKVWDENYKRFTLELICAGVELNYLELFELSKMKLNKKYQPEIDDFEDWLAQRSSNRRQVVYFNNRDFKKRMQCISLVQQIDHTLIIYQRSGDTVKMLDDFIFFTYLTTYFRIKIQTIKIFYGSLHTETT